MRRRNTQFKTFKACLASMKKADKTKKKYEFDPDWSPEKMGFTYDKKPAKQEDFYPDWMQKDITDQIKVGAKIPYYPFSVDVLEKYDPEKAAKIMKPTFTINKVWLKASKEFPNGWVSGVMDGHRKDDIQKVRSDIIYDSLSKLKKYEEALAGKPNKTFDFSRSMASAVKRIVMADEVAKQPRTREKFTDADCARLLDQETRNLGGIDQLKDILAESGLKPALAVSATRKIRNLYRSWNEDSAQTPIVEKGLDLYEKIFPALYKDDSQKADLFAQWFLCELHSAYVDASQAREHQGNWPLLDKAEKLLKKWVPKFNGVFKPEPLKGEESLMEKVREVATLELDKGMVAAADFPPLWNLIKSLPNYQKTAYLKEFNAIRSDAIKSVSPSGVMSPKPYGDDIGVNLAINAFRGTSFSPERRGADTLKDYNNLLIKVKKELEDYGRSQPEPVDPFSIEEVFERYRSGLKKRWVDWLSSESRVMSTMIAGRGNFPVRKMEKRLGYVETKQKEKWRFEKEGLETAKKKLRSLGKGESKEKSSILSEKEKLAEMEKNLEDMKAINKITRSKSIKQADKIKQLMNLGLKKSTAETVTQSLEAVYPSVTLTNFRNRIKYQKAKVAKIERAILLEEETPTTGILKVEFDVSEKRPHAGYVEYNVPQERIKIIFEDGDALRNDATYRAKLKKAALRFAGSTGAWQRKLTDNGIWSVRNLLGLSYKQMPEMHDLKKAMEKSNPYYRF